VKDYQAAAPMVLRLVEAIVRRQRCRVEYRAPWRARANAFPFDPYRLLTVHGGLYCLGRVPAYRNPVTLAVDRIQALALTDEGFTPDPALDLKRYEAEAFGVAWEKPMTVVVRFSADQAPYVREREWHPTQRFHTLKDGRLEMTFRAGGAFEIIRWVLGWGDAAEIVSPSSLRRAVATGLKAAATQYRGRVG